MAESSQAETLFIGQQLLRLQRVSSTNEFLKNLIGKDQSLVEGYAVLASHQTSGRGQMGNQWKDREGQNVLLSVYLKPDWLNATHFFQLNMSVCLAVWRCLSSFVSGFAIKWPNDLLYDRKKVAGILIENNISQGKLSSSVIGIGININQEHFDAGLRKATSLSKIVGHSLDLELVVKRLLESLEDCYLLLQRNPQKLRMEYFSALYGYREEIKLRLDAKVQSGFLEDVAEDGQVKIRLNGQLRSFRFKEFEFVL